MMTNNRILFISLGLILLFGCESEPKKWVFTSSINLDGITPIGILADGDNFWLSDVSKDRLVKIDKTGKILDEINNLLRPMHIDGDGKNIYIPLFGEDKLVRWDGNSIETITISDSLDGPGGVANGFGVMAVADFFNHQVLVTTQDSSFIIGKKGHDNGSLYYPTDVDITAEHINIADAYNNRVEVYDHSGNYIRTIGWEEGIRVATGVEVGNQQFFITDFHGSRLLIYDVWGQLEQKFSEGLSDPTDALLVGDKLYVTNFKGQTLSVYELK